MITVTQAAADAALASLKAEGGDPAQKFLRVAVAGGGCSGMNYKLTFDSEPRPGDAVSELGPLRVAVDPKSMLFLEGLTLDFSSGLNGKGFVFSNPNATGTCGCGQSFKV